MATSIFFTESKDFKLIKDLLKSQEDNYLVYVYADTSNIRIPKELIKELPVWGNNLIWIDTANMDANELSNHIILTIGQYLNQEEEINFYIVSRTSRLDKTVFFLRNQGIPVESISPVTKGPAEPAGKTRARRGRKPKTAGTEKSAASKTSGRGRRKEATTETEGEPAPEAQKRKGRPKKVVEQEAGTEMVPTVEKKKGRKKKEAPEAAEEKPAMVKGAAAGKKPKVVKEKKPRKPRVEKEITVEEVEAKIAAYPDADPNMVSVLQNLFSQKKVSRPKLESKLIDMIKMATLEDDTVAEKIVGQMKELGIVDQSGAGGRLVYKD